jgi:hypothetical protein
MSLQPFKSAFIDRQLRVPVDVESGQVLALGSPSSLGIDGRKVQWILASRFAVPYNVAWVELEEGTRLISTVITADLSTLRIGMPLTASFEPSGRLVFIPS